MSFCWECAAPLEMVVGKRNGGKRCRKCKNAAVVKHRHNDPCKRLQHRLYNTFHRMWPKADKNLWSMKTVKEVWERCEQKSVISGETNPELLCISYKHKPAEKDDPPLLEDLVVITSKEAQSFAKLSLQDRLAKFNVPTDNEDAPHQ